MKDILIASDIIPVGQFKSGLAKYLQEIQNKRNTLIITQNGKPAGVLMSPSEYDEMRQTKLFIADIKN
jgi:prevent-host-death family protein